MGLVRRKGGSGLPSTSSASSEVCALMLQHATLADFLLLDKWPDGSSRLTGTITLLADGGVLKAALNDRDADLSAFVSGRSLTSLLEAVEAALGDEDTEWRAKKATGGNGRKLSR